MKVPIFSVLMIATIFFLSCSQTTEYVIKGNVTGFPDSTMMYLHNLSTDVVFDSTMIIKNQFEYRGVLQEVPERIWLYATVNNKIVYLPLLIGNEKIKITGDIKDFPYDVQVTGSKTQDEYIYLRDLIKSYNKEKDSLVNYYFSLSPELMEEKKTEIWREKIPKIDNVTDSIRKDFIKSHIDTYEGIIQLGSLKKSYSKDSVQSLYNQIPEKLKASKYAKIIKIYLTEKISEIGDKYHDFEAYNQQGKKIIFSDIIDKEEKYVLLDFTSAGCGPCIQAAKELHTISQTYSDSLIVVSFSVDANKKWWLNSLERDSVIWTSLWDGEGTHGTTYIKYGVSGFPTFFLIDPQGIIVDKWFGYGNGLLENKLGRLKNK